MRALKRRGEDSTAKAAMDEAGYPPFEMSEEEQLRLVSTLAATGTPRQREVARTRKGLKKLVANAVFQARMKKHREGPPKDRPVWYTDMDEVREAPRLRVMLDEIGAPQLPRARVEGDRDSRQFEIGVRQAATASGAVREKPEDTELSWPEEERILEWIHLDMAAWRLREAGERATEAVRAEITSQVREHFTRFPPPSYPELTPDVPAGEDATAGEPEVGDEADTGVEFVPETEAGEEQPKEVAQQQGVPTTSLPAATELEQEAAIAIASMGGVSSAEALPGYSAAGSYTSLPAASFNAFDSFDTGVFLPPVVEAHLALAESEPTAVTTGAEFLSAGPPVPPKPPLPARSTPAPTLPPRPPLPATPAEVAGQLAATTWEQVRRNLEATMAAEFGDGSMEDPVRRVAADTAGFPPYSPDSTPMLVAELVEDLRRTYPEAPEMASVVVTNPAQVRKRVADLVASTRQSFAALQFEPTEVQPPEPSTSAPPPPPPPPIPWTGPRMGPATTWDSVEETLKATLEELYPDGPEESPKRKEQADAALYPPMTRGDAAGLLRSLMSDLRTTYGTTPAVAYGLAASAGRVQEHASHRMFRFRQNLVAQSRQSPEGEAEQGATEGSRSHRAGGGCRGQGTGPRRA